MKIKKNFKHISYFIIKFTNYENNGHTLIIKHHITNRNGI